VPFYERDDVRANDDEADSSFSEHAQSIQAMVGRLAPGNDYWIGFEVGKLGRVDRFVLKNGGSGSVVEVIDFVSRPRRKPNLF
jgi:hypothetical protein